MRMSDEEYFRSCVAKERHLAHLLGHHQVEEFYESAGTLWEENHPLPQWTRDWNAAGRLMTEYELVLDYHAAPADDPYGDAVGIGPVLVHYADHPNRERAVMFAIVKAVIHRLEHRHATPHKH